MIYCSPSTEDTYVFLQIYYMINKYMNNVLFLCITKKGNLKNILILLSPRYFGNIKVFSQAV